MPEYDTITGTQPNEHARHEARVMTRTDADGTLSMMTEIEDGVFVQWGTCATCSTPVGTCSCKDGPQPPKYIAEWRDKRFKNSLKGRPAKLADALTKKQLKELTASVQKAQDAAAYGDSNDSEIELLWGALEEVLGLLGLELPEGKDPDDESDETPMWKDYVDQGVGADIDKIQAADKAADASDVRQNVDDGLDQAMNAVKAAKEDKTDVGF